MMFICDPDYNQVSKLSIPQINDKNSGELDKIDIQDHSDPVKD